MTDILKVKITELSAAEQNEYPNIVSLGVVSGQTKKYPLSDIYAKIGDKVDKINGKGLSQNDYTTAEKNKLQGVAAGAQVNTVTSVAGKTGAVTLAKSDVGLGNVTNTSDTNKPVSTAQQALFNEHARVAAQATEELKEAVDSINVDRMGDATCNSIDMARLPSVCGYPAVVIEALSAGAAPAATPDFVGQIFIDTTNKHVYMAVGVTNATSWKRLDN